MREIDFEPTFRAIADRAVLRAVAKEKLLEECATAGRPDRAPIQRQIYKDTLLTLGTEWKTTRTIWLALGGSKGRTWYRLRVLAERGLVEVRKANRKSHPHSSPIHEVEWRCRA